VRVRDNWASLLEAMALPVDVLVVVAVTIADEPNSNEEADGGSGIRNRGNLG
jgi:hypothetical protein